MIEAMIATSMAHHAEGTPHRHPEQPQELEQTGGVGCDVSEQRLLEGVDQSHTDEPGDGRRHACEIVSGQARTAADRLDGLALIHGIPFPRPRAVLKNTVQRRP
jgi:hypothetical protein